MLRLRTALWRTAPFAGLGKEFKGDAKIIVAYYESLSDDAKMALKAEVDGAGKKAVEIEGKTFELLPKHVAFEVKEETQHTVSYTPNVIEPSFGIDRILYAIFEHSYYEREDEAAEKEVQCSQGGQGGAGRGRAGLDHQISGLMQFILENMTQAPNASLRLCLHNVCNLVSFGSLCERHCSHCCSKLRKPEGVRSGAL